MGLETTVNCMVIVADKLIIIFIFEMIVVIFRTNMVERSKEMIEELRKLGVGEHPIVWVGHSKGGLFIKQILVSGK